MCVSFDEVKVKEDLIYEIHSLKLIGFVQLGDVNDHSMKFMDRKFLIHSQDLPHTGDYMYKKS